MADPDPRRALDVHRNYLIIAAHRGNNFSEDACNVVAEELNRMHHDFGMSQEMLDGLSSILLDPSKTPRDRAQEVAGPHRAGSVTLRGAMTPFTEILPNTLYMGGKEAADRMKRPPSVHVYTAPCSYSQSSRLLRFPLEDNPLWSWREDEAGTERLMRLSRTLAKLVLEGRSVLVTCAMGQNRSGLVTALTLCSLGFKPQESIRLLQKLRGDAVLNNGAFYDCVCELGGDLARNPVRTYKTRRSPDLETIRQSVL